MALQRSAMGEELKTSESMLARLKDGDQQAWTFFYGRYSPVIIGFCLKRGFDDFGARDLLQETMVIVIRKLPGFVYDRDKGRFSNWLLTIVARKINDMRRRTNRCMLLELDALEDASALRGELAAMRHTVEADWRCSLLEEALRRVQRDPKIKSGTFEVFRHYVLDEIPINEVASKYGLEKNAVYQIKNRVIKKLRQELSDLELPLAETIG